MTTTAANTALSHSMGQKGFKYLSAGGTTSYSTTNTIAIQAIENSEITVTSVKGDNLSAVTIAAGTIIVGEFTAVSLSSGSVLAYLA